MAKKENLDKLYKKYKETFYNEEVVPGDGNIDTRLLLVGEAPGKDEVKLSKPFVGMAGKNLSEFLDILGLDRSEIYITNAIKFRLSKVNPKTGRVSNRPATREDIETSREYLLEEIDMIQPEYIVTLGNVPLRAVTGDFTINIGPIHGKVRVTDVLGNSYKLFPLYHPASIIYNRSLKDVYLEDIERLKNEYEKHNNINKNGA